MDQPVFSKLILINEYLTENFKGIRFCIHYRHTEVNFVAYHKISPKYKDLSFIHKRQSSPQLGIPEINLKCLTI